MEVQDDDPTAYYAAYGAAKKRHLEVLLAKVNVEALESAASKAQQRILCQITALSNPSTRADLTSSQCGGQNCHVDVEFVDGVTWLARIRLDDPLPPAGVQASVFLSEVATLEFLANTQVPAPHVYAYEPASPANAVGTSYVLMEKLAGKPLDWNRATAEQRARVMEGLADVYLELEKHPIPLSGPLVPGTDGQVTVGAFAQVPWFETPEQALGPFGTLEASYTAIVLHHLRMLASLALGNNLLVDNYLTFLWRLSALPQLVADSASRAGPFYLKHCDDKGDHILVDDEHNITGIIDWEFASAEAKELAFSSPCMVWPVGDFYDGSNALAEDEVRFADIFEQRGRGDLGKMVRGGRPWQRYLFFLGGRIPREMIGLEPLFQGLRKSMPAGENNAAAISSYLDWKQGALAGLSKQGAQLLALLRDERAKGEGSSK
ncbi:hypothetical protein B0T24DRAFT_715471 [Lasiosphaeria ovina]|uniref:Aminoglycoside phosphotransferase domain-containing protein n=1 Tax=Lasiosphaeria ovina TaxID=92902 RepID=A0AAE0NLC3_9PEZI|nr:hypothetical protein B0T24DRAFT_715471 [Lasiosphaeria ovina]